MIDPQTRHGTDRRTFDDVGGIVLAANTALDDCRVDAFAEVGVESHECQEAEVDRFRTGREVKAGCGSFETVPDIEEIVGKENFTEGLRIYLDAFADGAEVRRGVKSHFGGTLWFG